jgi:hypothetical protein
VRTRSAPVVVVVGAAVCLSLRTIGGQTVITPPDNKVPWPETGLVPGRVAAPSSTYTVYTEGDLFRVSVPSNWRERPGSNTVAFAPDGAYGEDGTQSLFTHGVEIGVTRNGADDLRTATDELLASLARGNPDLSRPSGYDRTKIGGRHALYTVISHLSDATGEQERIALFTMLLADGGLFYTLGIAPRGRFSDYEATFRRVVGSIQIID